MIYKLVNRRTEVQAIATSHLAHLCNRYNHVFALLISMPRFNSINFIKIGVKSVASLCMVTPGAEFYGVTFHNVYTVICKRLYLKDSGTTSMM